VDANAISPATARGIGTVIDAAGGTFVDGGIIGLAPTAQKQPTLYLSGTQAAAIAVLFTGTNINAEVIEGGAGAASGLKMCYAAFTKGTTALLKHFSYYCVLFRSGDVRLFLTKSRVYTVSSVYTNRKNALAAVRALAEHEGVERPLLESWRRTLPDVSRQSEHAAAAALKAWRWSGEMDEIAASFAAAGLPDGFHRAAAEVCRRLESFKDRTTPPSMAEVTEAMLRSRR
jgi:hypothetical protein